MCHVLCDDDVRLNKAKEPEKKAPKFKVYPLFSFQVSDTSTDNQFEIETVREEIKEALLNNEKSLAITKIKELLDKERNTPLNIAIQENLALGNPPLLMPSGAWTTERRERP